MVAWAFVIGINEYPVESRQAQLHGAVADAADFADWALDPAGGAVLPEHMFLWTMPAPAASPQRLAAFLQNPTRWPFVGPDFGRAPHASEIKRAIAEIARKAVAGGAERLYVFFAGHGAQTKPRDYEEDPQNCFIVGDFAPDMPSLGLVPCDDLRRYLKGQGPAELVLFFDCCRNTLPLKVPRPSGGFNVLGSNGLHRRLAVGRASQDETVAYEVPIGVPVPERGAFSKLLIAGLRDFRVGGQLTMKDLQDYVTSGIGDLVKPHQQLPDFDERPLPRGLVLAVGRPLNAQPPIRVDSTGMTAGTELLLLDKDAQLVTTFMAGPTTHVFHLPIGGYSIELRDESVIAAFNHVGPGATDVGI